MSLKKRAESWILVSAVLGSLLLVNVVGAGVFYRFDLTRNGEFTLSSATIDTLAALQDPVTIRAYFSAEMPPPYSSISRYVKDLLDEYYAHGRGNLRYEFIDPTSVESDTDKQKKKELKQDVFGRVVREQTSVEKELTQLGVQPLVVRVNQADKVEQKMVYMGIALTYRDRKEVIPVVENTENLELDLTTLVRKISRDKVPRIALLTGHGTPDVDKELGAFVDLLRQKYEVSPLDLSQEKEPKIGDDVQAVLVIGPQTPYAEEEKKALDRFIQSGRSAAFLLGAVAVDLTSLQPRPLDHGLTDLLKTYGVTLESGLALDLEAAHIPITQQNGNVRVTRQVQYHFIIAPKALDRQNPLTRGLTMVAFPFMGPVSAQSSPGVTAEVLVKTSPNGWLQSPPFNLDPFHTWTREEAGELSSRDLMVSLSGKLPGAAAGSAGPGSRILVANGHAFVLDPFMSKGNQSLAMNLMDWLLLDEALLAVRSRGLDASPLEEISDGRRNTLKYLNMIGLPLSFVLFGLGRWRLREARRSRVRL